MTKKYILAHDTGTGGDKAVLTDLQGRVIHSAYQDYGIYYPQAEWAEQDPEELWRTVAATTRKVIAEAASTRARSWAWAFQRRCSTCCRWMKKVPPSPACSAGWTCVRCPRPTGILSGDTPRFLFDKTGNIPTAKDIIPKILWLKEERPEFWQRTAHLLDCKEYIIFRLTGNFATDWHGASVYFLFDPQKKEWSQQVLDAWNPARKTAARLPLHGCDRRGF